MKEDFLRYISSVRRYSQRTVDIYSAVIDEFESSCGPELSIETIRDYELWMLDEKHLSERTVSQHLSVLSAYCRFLIMEGKLSSNPVHMVKRPKMSKRLPVMIKPSAMDEYFLNSDHAASEDELVIFLSTPHTSPLSKDLYERRLRRLIISILFSCGIRRAELISLDNGSVDFGRMTMTVRGKGDKTRVIPLTSQICKELSLYMKARSSVMEDGDRNEPLLRTWTGRRLYAVYVDRAVKHELGSEGSITGRKSPHVLRHTLATRLLDNGTDLNSIKEMLGHSSLAATQVYTHNSIEKMRTVYNDAHPRSKKESD